MTTPSTPNADPETDPPFAGARGWTAPSAIPSDVAKKILAARDALSQNDIEAAYHELYSIANPGFDSFYPWHILEAQANDQALRPGDTK